MSRKPIKGFFVIAHNIRSLFNVGSIFRTADAFGVEKIFLTGYTGTPALAKHRLKIAKVALGAQDYVPWEYHRFAISLIKQLKAANLNIIALENNVKAVKLPKFKPRFPLALVLGEERGGVNKKILALCDEVVEIPMRGKKESLNVSVAFGIAAYALQ